MLKRRQTNDDDLRAHSSYQGDSNAHVGGGMLGGTSLQLPAGSEGLPMTLSSTEHCFKRMRLMEESGSDGRSAVESQPESDQVFGDQLEAAASQIESYLSDSALLSNPTLYSLFSSSFTDVNEHILATPPPHGYLHPFQPEFRTSHSPFHVGWIRLATLVELLATAPSTAETESPIGTTEVHNVALCIRANNTSSIEALMFGNDWFVRRKTELRALTTDGTQEVHIRYNGVSHSFSKEAAPSTEKKTNTVIKFTLSKLDGSYKGLSQLCNSAAFEFDLLSIRVSKISKLSSIGYAAQNHVSVYPSPPTIPLNVPSESMMDVEPAPIVANPSSANNVGFNRLITSAQALKFAFCIPGDLIFAQNHPAGRKPNRQVGYLSPPKIKPHPSKSIPLSFEGLLDLLPALECEKGSS
ncbi:hypothetical protein P7C70_g5512, partial [Phenoliferia sp. Uapishka_3]